MKNATIKIKRNIQSVNITNNNIEMSRVILNSMLATLGFLALVYFFILGTMVFNIVGRNNLEKQNLALSNQVGSLELSYLSVSSSVDVALSSSMGFKAIPVTYAIRPSLGFNTTASSGSLKINNNEI